MKRFSVVVVCSVMAFASLALPIDATQSGMAFHQSYVVRAALGDIPSTEAKEPAATWNVEETVTYVGQPGVGPNISFPLPAGAALVGVSCTCSGAVMTPTADGILFMAPADANGTTHRIRVEHATTMPTTGPLPFRLGPTNVTWRPDAIIVLYLPEAYVLESTVTPDYVLPSTKDNPGLLIHQFSGTPEAPLPSTLPFRIMARTAAEAGPDAASLVTSNPAGPSDALPWLGGLAAVGAAAAVVYLLFRRARRQRPHLDAGPTEPSEPSDPEALVWYRVAYAGALAALESSGGSGAAYGRVHAQLTEAALELLEKADAGGASATDGGSERSVIGPDGTKGETAAAVRHDTASRADTTVSVPTKDDAALTDGVDAPNPT